MPAPAPRLDSAEPEGLVASPWHTVLLVALIVAVAALGTALSSRPAPPTATGSYGRIATLYLPTILVEWALVLYVSRFGRRSRASAFVVVRGRPGRRIAGDLVCAAAAWLVVASGEAIHAYLMGASAAATRDLLPRGALETAFWVALSISAGFGEEVVYRGYLQRQFTAWIGRAHVAIFLQGALFGLAHLAEGPATAVRIAVYGIGLGVLAARRGGILAGIVAHTGLDLAAGLSGGG